jgi:hypothetical protein
MYDYFYSIWREEAREYATEKLKETLAQPVVHQDSLFSIFHRAYSDELAERFSHEATHEQVGYDS